MGEKYLKTLRERAGLTQKELADTLGYSVSLVSAWDNGKSFPDFTCWKALCDLYQVPLSSFLKEEFADQGHVYSPIDFSSEAFSQRLQTYRKEKGIIQAELAKTLGVNAKTPSSWERGASYPSKENFLRLCELYGCSPESLFYGIEDKHTSKDLATLKEPAATTKKPIMPKWAKIVIPAIVVAIIAAVAIALPLTINNHTAPDIEDSSSDTSIEATSYGASFSLDYQSETESPHKPYEDDYSDPVEVKEVAGKTLAICVGPQGKEIYRGLMPYGAYPSSLSFYPSPYAGEEMDELFVFAGWEEKERIFETSAQLHAKYVKISAKSYYSSGFTFVFNDDESSIYLLSYTGDLNVDTLEIPSFIGEYPVTKVGQILLNKTNSIRFIVFPETVKSIIGLILSGSSHLEEVILPNALEEAPWHLLSQCNNLALSHFQGGLYLGSKNNPHLLLAGIESESFEIAASCRLLSPFIDQIHPKSIKIPANVAYIGQPFIQYLGSASEIIVAGDNPHYYYEGGCLIDKTNDALLFVSSGATSIKGDIRSIQAGALFCYQQSSLVIPDSVVEVETGALADQFESISIGKNLLYINPEDLSCNASLKKINIDKDNPSYTSASGMMFSKDLSILFVCPPRLSLVSFVLPKETTMIYPHCFYLQGSLKEIYFCSSEYDSLRAIGEMAFDSCSALEKVYFSTSMEIIPSYAFYHCYALSSIYLKAGLKEIENQAFYPASALKDVYFDGDITEWNGIAIGREAFFEGNPTIHLAA